MNANLRINHRFVEFIPADLEPGIIYISMEYATTTHLCACGCGEKVVLPLHPHDWSLSFDGKAVSLRPSVGNWSFKCQSHYFISGNRIEWARKWSEQEIQRGRKQDRQRHISPLPAPKDQSISHAPKASPPWQRFILACKRLLGRRA